MKNWLEELTRAIAKPTGKQKEAVCRYLHSLSAVCAVGTVSFVFSGQPWSWSLALKVAALAFWGVVLFF
ncbi:hypothetical protein [Cupriavidus basilensis]|uniref:hypothetical protein n=1 Tax=Cupriavidus basilensis TaxID=68895 RepID=UPI0039F73B7B